MTLEPSRIVLIPAEAVRTALRHDTNFTVDVTEDLAEAGLHIDGLRVTITDPAAFKALARAIGCRIADALSRFGPRPRPNPRNP